MIVIDGAKGEGGGQVLRTALSLSACTGQPFRIKNIRAGRKKPGLMRQHLTCVQAAAEVCGGKATGAHLGSTELTFTPGEPKGGHFSFDVGTAGATTLVFQTVLPILLIADEVSEVRLSGGTHTVAAPTFEFVESAFLPPLGRMGAEASLTLDRPGFYPAGGGAWSASIQPLKDPKPLSLVERGELIGVTCEAFAANLPSDIGRREFEVCRRAFQLDPHEVSAKTFEGPGPGNAVLVFVDCDGHSEVFSGIGRRGVQAETVASRAASLAKRYLASEAAVSEHLADQLLLPLALFGGGSFTVETVSSHFKTNVETIRLFLDISVGIERSACGVRVEVVRC